MNGVSIVICCYNSANRLSPTLQHLKQQVVPIDIPWEVLVVDNASTDSTAETARALWPTNVPAILRVVSEPRPGLSHARQRGFAEAQYSLVSFVDDDNWVAADWITTVYEVMISHPDVGACGGTSEAVFEVKPPEWYSDFHSKIAVGDQFAVEADVTNTRGWLWGAGITIRKRIWEEILQQQEPFILSGRTKKKMTSGEDNEICYILRLKGWRLYYTPYIKFKHFIPSSRLHWNYFCRMAAENGYTVVVAKRYIQLIQNSEIQTSFTYLKSWINMIYSSTRKCAAINLKGNRSNYPGSKDYLRYLTLLSQLKALIMMGPHGLYQIDRKIVRWKVN